MNLFYRNLIFNIPLFASIILVPGSAFSQAGVSSGSVGAARSGIYQTIGGRYRLPKPDLFRIEEFINYHRHDIPVPGKNDPIVKLNVQRLDLDNGKSVFQFGIATPRNLDFEKLAPLNLVLVVDESSSMSGDRIKNVRKSLHKLLERFRDTDRVSIVTFNHNARVELEATEKADIGKIRSAINALAVGGSTNLHKGLMLGYKTALSNFDPERTNRMIFLTDGNANVGETESKEIARQSKRCNDEGISLMTIGLGVDFNDGLLQEIANAGYGTTHFIADNKDIQKIFVDEVDSLLAPAAQNVRLCIDFGKTKKQPKIYGYQPKQSKSRYEFALNDLNHGATQLVMAKVAGGGKLFPEVTLEYIDALSNQKVEVVGELAKTASEKSLRRNYSIAILAESLHQAAHESNDDDCEAAQLCLKKGLDKAKRWMPKKDEQVQRVAKIASEYRGQILACIAQNRD